MRQRTSSLAFLSSGAPFPPDNEEDLLLAPALGSAGPTVEPAFAMAADADAAEASGISVISGAGVAAVAAVDAFWICAVVVVVDVVAEDDLSDCDFAVRSAMNCLVIDSMLSMFRASIALVQLVEIVGGMASVLLWRVIAVTQDSLEANFGESFARIIND